MEYVKADMKSIENDPVFNNLTRFKDDIRFVWHNLSGRVRYVFKMSVRDEMLLQLQKDYGADNISENEIGDLIILTGE